jgi:hypothetical protein
MTTATRTLKAPRHMSRVRNVAVRTVRVTGRDRDRNVAAMEIKTGYEIDSYSVHAEPVEDGMRYTVEKQGGDEGPYTVVISESMGNTCCCKGYKYGGKCRHISALLTIAARDQQRPVPMTCEAVKAAMESDDAAAWE